jgi:hypothetical protein
MFTIIFKLVGYDISSGEHDYKVTIDEPDSFLTEKHIIDSFTIPGVIDIDTINMIRFIYKGSTLSLDKTHIMVDNDNVLNIHVFTSSMEIRRKLVENIFTSLKIFLDEKPLPEKIILPEVIEEKEIMTDDVIEGMNTNIVKLFSDEDFTNLLRIILNKPHLLNIASSYIQHGDVVKIQPPDNPTDFVFTYVSGANRDQSRLAHETEITRTFENGLDRFRIATFTYMEQYDKVIDIMKKLNVDIVGYEDEIKNLLCKFKGHLNLTLRCILISVFDL